MVGSIKKQRNNKKQFIIDTCVLEDYLKADPSLFQLISKYIGKIRVISAVIDESNEIKKHNFNVGLILVEPKIEDALNAKELPRSLSFPDALTFLTAKRFGFNLITNDKKLRNKCLEENIETIWGLELIVQLNHKGGILQSQAENIGRTIHSNNPKHITSEILAKFMSLLK